MKPNPQSSTISRSPSSASSCRERFNRNVNVAVPIEAEDVNSLTYHCKEWVQCILCGFASWHTRCITHMYWILFKSAGHFQLLKDKDKNTLEMKQKELLTESLDNGFLVYSTSCAFSSGLRRLSLSGMSSKAKSFRRAASCSSCQGP